MITTKFLTKRFGPSCPKVGGGQAAPSGSAAFAGYPWSLAQKDHGDVDCASVGGNRFPNVKMFSYKLPTPIRLAPSRDGHGLFT